jgi:steroid 5-alpha reductase family enzyme
MNLWTSTLVHLAVSVMTVFGVWLWYRRTDNAAWIDTAWGALIGIGAVIHPLASGASSLESWGLSLLMTAWSVRLTIHLYRRVAHEPEDGRYTALRSAWTARFGADKIPGRFLRFYLMQAFLATALALPAGLVAFDHAARWGVWQELSILVGIVSLVGAYLSDSQLAHFREIPSNKGKTCRDGFWQYSRHPNYFFEILLWVSFALYATTAPGGAWAWLAPISIAFFLVKVTGIPLTEAQSLRSRGDDYRRYIQTTSALLPWFPLREKNP